MEIKKSKSPGVHTGSGECSGSLCAPWQAQIQKAVEGGLSVQRIYQDLVSDHHFSGSYYSVRRFVQRLRPEGAELPFDAWNVNLARSCRSISARGRGCSKRRASGAGRICFGVC